MAKNYMPDVAKLLGVELEEEFNIDSRGKTIYKLTEKGLFALSILNGWEKYEDFLLAALLCGELTIKKLPWKPKNGDTYCSVYWERNTRTNKWEIGVAVGTFGDRYSQHNFYADVGNCFRTRKEAEAQKYEIFKRLTGKDWHETYGKEGGDGNV